MNDYLWFDSASIYEMLGLNEDGEEPEDEDETPPDLSAYDNFDSFCESFGNSCAGCPFEYLHGNKCEDRFDEIKKGGLVYA